MDRLIALSFLLCSYSCALFVPAERSGTEQIVFHHQAAGKVQLIGDWNNWGGITGATSLVDPACGAMVNDNGIWTASLPGDLQRGRYRYALLVNGTQFFPDPLNPERTLFNEQEVSVLIVN